MAFKEDLVANKKSDASAYLQFISGHGREGFTSYAFVEDDDDVVFYQHALHSAEGLSYISCGGKENVLKVYLKLKSDGVSDSLLFFVDKDTEQEPFHHGDDVCRTTVYSWENYIVQPSSCSRILSRRYRPSLTPAQQKVARENWFLTVNSFKDVLKAHTGLTRLSNEKSLSLGMKDVQLARNICTDEFHLSPSIAVAQEVEKKMVLAQHAGVSELEVKNMIAQYDDADLLEVSRGKSLYSVFKTFLRQVEKVSGKRFFGDLSSPLALLSCLAGQDRLFDFIRQYAFDRVPKLQEC